MVVDGADRNINTADSNPILVNNTGDATQKRLSKLVKQPP